MRPSKLGISFEGVVGEGDGWNKIDEMMVEVRSWLELAWKERTWEDGEKGDAEKKSEDGTGGRRVREFGAGEVLGEGKTGRTGIKREQG